MKTKPHDHWRVEISTNGNQIVAIEPNMLCGRDISDKDESTIIEVIEHLKGFIGYHE